MNFGIVLIPALFALSVGIIFKSLVQGSGRRYKQEKDKFIREESLANRQKNFEIPADFFIKPLSNFGSSFELENEVLQKLNLSINKKSEKLMIFPQKEKSLELKKKYGSDALKKISNYEENYYSYVHTLNAFAQLLIDEGYFEEAKETINYIISHMKSDLQKSQDMIKQIKNTP